MIPGLSGGSTAMLLNIYDKMIRCMAELTKNFKSNFLFLLKISLGILFGFIIFSFFLYEITTYSFFNYLVAVIIIINILFLTRKTKLKFNNILLVLIGMFSLNILQKTQLVVDLNQEILPFIITGILLGLSLILPGLGITYVLYILGLYDTFNLAIINFDYVFLIKIGLCTIFGIIITVKLLNYLLKNRPSLVYSLVIGLLIGSLDLGFDSTISIINTMIVGLIFIFSNNK